jgi:hypothetical protein
MEHPAMTPADFLQIFNERRRCFAELLEQSRTQQQLVETEAYDELLTLLARKQQLIGRLEEIGRTRPDLGRDWRAARDGLSSLARDTCDRILEETENLLRELMERERESTAALAQRRDETRRQLQTVAAGSRVNDEYRDSLAPATNRFLDIDQ